MDIRAKFDKFKSDVDDYINNNNLNTFEFKEEFKIAETLTIDELAVLTQDDCFNYSFMLYQYCDYINLEKGRQDGILMWCKSALSDIIAREVHNFDKYTKHEIRVSTIVNENEVAKTIDLWKKHAEARVLALGNKEQIVRQKANCLMEKGKRK